MNAPPPEATTQPAASWREPVGQFLREPRSATGLVLVAGLVFVAASVFAISTGGALFTACVVVIAAVGASTYAYLYIRAGLSPMINEADPSTWDSLLAVIRREQYPPRLPTDNPMFPSGPGNPGKSG